MIVLTGIKKKATLRLMFSSFLFCVDLMREAFKKMEQWATTTTTKQVDAKIEEEEQCLDIVNATIRPELIITGSHLPSVFPLKHTYYSKY